MVPKKRRGLGYYLSKKEKKKEEEYLLETLAGKIAIYGYLRGLLQSYCAQKERMACICALARAARLQPRRCPLSSLVHCDCECCVRKNSGRVWFVAYGATPRRRCGGRIGRRNLGTVWRHRRQTKQALNASCARICPSPL